MRLPKFNPPFLHPRHPLRLLLLPPPSPRHLLLLQTSPIYHNLHSTPYSMSSIRSLINTVIIHPLPLHPRPSYHHQPHHHHSFYLTLLHLHYLKHFPSSLLVFLSLLVKVLPLLLHLPAEVLVCLLKYQLQMIIL